MKILYENYWIHAVREMQSRYRALCTHNTPSFPVEKSVPLIQQISYRFWIFIAINMPKL